MRIRATKDGLKVGPEYFSVDVLLQVLPTWRCPYEEMVVQGDVLYGVTDGIQHSIDPSYGAHLKLLSSRLHEFIQARRDIQLLKQDAVEYGNKFSSIGQIRIVTAADDWTYGEPVIVKFGFCHARRWRWHRGEGLTGHTHFFDHVSWLMKGSASVVRRGAQTIYSAARGVVEIIIPADEEHSVTALEDDTRWYCVFADRDAYGEVDLSSKHFDVANTQ